MLVASSSSSEPPRRPGWVPPLPVLTRPLLRALGLGAVVIPIQAFAGILDGAAGSPGGGVALNLFTWVGTFLFIVGAINQVMRLVEYFRPKPAIAEVYMTKEQAGLFLSQMRDRHAEMEARIEALSGSRESNRQTFRDDINDLRSEVITDIRRVHERLDNLPAQIIANLATTGAFGRPTR